MFNSLKKKLSSFKNSFGDILDKQAEEASEDIQQAGSKSVTKEEKKETPSVAVGIGQKAKALLLNREFIISEKKLEEPLWDLEVALLESDVALEVAEEVVGYVKSELVGTNYKIGGNKNDIVEQALRKALINVLNVETLDFDDYIEQANKPVNIAFVGVNGTGKTTTISKIAKRLKDRGYSVVLAAGDTFRAGAIDQLQRHADNLGLKMIKHQEGGDPAAVIYDSVEYAKARKIDVVLADTAGRMHTNINLMDQLKKICRVSPPDLVIFVDEAIAGNDAVERAQLFNQTVPISGSILTKSDADSKGGAAISIAHTTGKPILFFGVGQEYDDIVKFDPQWLVDRLFE
ncbi:MAG: signal recognition particle-docking protein FtsY [ANME-2 cluster archaeon]|jgi:fused signal recognition particle receptor|nr:signal recognition particle-docking protein FtsY [ANME-2 cluster archaeon]